MAVLQGIEDLERKFALLGRELQQKTLLKFTKKGGELIRAEAEARAPRDTGALAEGERVSAVTSQLTSTEAVVRIGPSKEEFYGRFQEFGTAHHPPQPFLHPAFEDKKDEAFRVIADGLKQTVDDFVRTHGEKS